MKPSTTLRHLEVFLALESKRNFGGAASLLGISQPALSKAIMLAEEALGTKLFYRDTRTVEITAAGKALLPMARRLVGDFNHAMHTFNEYIEGYTGRVVIASSPSAGVALLPPVIAKYTGLYPQVEFVFRSLPEQEVVALVRSGIADFGITTRPPAEDWASFHQITSDEFVMICSYNDALAKRGVVKWADFSARPFIAMDRTTGVRTITDHTFRQLNIAMDYRYECDHVSVAGSLVAAGLGLSAQPRMSLRLIDCSRLAIVALQQPVVRRNIGIVTRNEIAIPPAAKRLLDFLLEEQSDGQA